MTMEIEGLPSRPFFNCTPEGLDILDSREMSGAARLDAIEPWMRFELGDRNIIDSKPRKAASSKPGQGHGGVRKRTSKPGQVTVECESYGPHRLRRRKGQEGHGPGGVHLYGRPGRPERGPGVHSCFLVVQQGL